ncbi:MAG: hypothetical protein WC333_00195 [Dehalococcoidia bacterium]|jgi:hypothetical protein
MKKDRLYKTLKALVQECVDEMGLPKKPCVKVLYEAKYVVEKHENEMSETSRLKELPLKEIKEG